MANSYKNIVITPNTGSATGDPTVVFSGGNTTVNTDVTLRVYPDSNGTLSFEGAAGQLFSITNDLSNSIFSVNDVSGIPLIEVNVSSQQITLGEFYGNVGIGKTSSTSSIYKLDVNGTINASNVLINGSPITGVANLTPANNYTNTSVTAANNYTNTSTTAANNYAGAMANAANAYANTLGTNTSLAYSWTNTHTFSANVFYRNTSNIVWITNSASTTSNVTLKNYPDSNGTLSFEGSAGQLFSITNDLTGSIFAVNDVSGIPLIEVNVASQQITLGQFYGNVGIGTGASNSSIYKLDVAGSANISLPTLLVAGQNVLSLISTVGASGNNWANSVNTYSDSTYFKKTGGMVSGDVQITGNLNVMGNVTFTNTNSVVVSDPLLYLAGNNYTSDVVDIGIIANYVNSTFANVHTGVFRDATSKEWFVFEGYSQEPVNNHIDTNGNNFTLSVLNTNIRTSNLILGGANAITTIVNNAAGANGWANTKVSSVTGTSGRITSSGGTTPAIDLATAGAGAATYSSGISSITVDAYGRVTSVSGSANYTTGSGYLPLTGGTLSGGINLTSGAITPSVGSTSASGIQWPSNPGGGAGDSAFIRYYVVSGESTKFVIGTDNDADDTIALYQQGADRLTVYNGNVGIGTTTASYLFDVYNSSTASNYYISRLISEAAATGTSVTHLRLEKGNGYGGTVGGYISQGVGSGLVLSTLNGGTLSNAMWINNSGNVGIGNTNPDQKLMVAGNIRISDYGAIGPQSNNTGIVIHGGNNLSGNPTQSGIIFRGNTGGAGGTANNGLELYAGGAERMRIDGSGNVGIGNTSPSHKLSVNGTAYFSGKITSAVTAGTDGIDLVTFDAYANMRVMRNAGGGISDGMYIGYGNAGSATTKIYGGGATTGALEKFSTYTLEPGSFRAPIFYDSNDTNYYVDPNSATVLNGLYSNFLRLGPTNIGGQSANTIGQVYGLNGTGASLFAWNYTNGGGELDLIINRNGGGTGGLNIYDFTSNTITNLMTLTGAGNLGIGTTSPSSKLHVQGTASAVSDNGMLEIGDSSRNGISFGYNTTNNEAWIYGRSPGVAGRTINLGNGGLYVYNGSYAYSPYSFRAPIFYNSGDTNVRWSTNDFVLRGGSPTIFFRDTDHNSAMIHCNANILYFLRGGNDTESWSTVNGVWPLYLNLTNNDATFGGAVITPGSMYAARFYDNDNTAYYIDAAGDSRINIITADCLKVLNGGSFIWQHNSAGLNNKYWDTYSDSLGVLRFRAVNDAYNSATDWLTITRSGQTPQIISLYADTSIPTNSLSFGSSVRQMINLWSTSFGIGIQNNTQYFRSGSRFSWFIGGVHSTTENDAGSGGVSAMTLTNGNLTASGVIRDSKGDVRDIPATDRTASMPYTITIGDTGKMVLASGNTAASANVFIPNNVFFTGNTVMIVNQSTNNVTVTQNSGVTMFLAGSTSSGNRTLSGKGIATLICVGANNFIISGAGVF